MWSSDGKELFFVEGRTLMAVPVTAGEGFDVGVPRRLFDPRTRAGFAAALFDVSPDGRRFVTLETVDSPSISYAHLVVGWFAELARGTTAAR